MWPFKKKVKEEVVTGTVGTAPVQEEPKRNFRFDVSVKSISNPKLNIQFKVSNIAESYEKALHTFIDSAYSGDRWGSYECVLPSLQNQKDLYLRINLSKEKKPRKKKRSP